MPLKFLDLWPPTPCYGYVPDSYKQMCDSYSTEQKLLDQSHRYKRV
jgi:hypothetical protein